MPVKFPEFNPVTGELVEVDYFTAPELADMLHITGRTVTERARLDEWPHLKVGRTAYFNAVQVGGIMGLMKVDPPAIPEPPGPPRLAVPEDPDDTAPVT